MNTNKHLKQIDNFFENLTIKEFDKKLENAGINEVKSNRGLNVESLLSSPIINVEMVKIEGGTNMTKERKRTICWLIEDLKDFDSVKGNIGILSRLDEIQYKVEKMEDRLLEYCNAIEDLGFVRIGRNYSSQ